MKFHIVIKKSVHKELRRIQKQTAEKILSKIAQLADQPFPDNCVKLTDFEIDGLQYNKLYRIRVGVTV